MLVSPREQEIVSNAWEAGIRDPSRAYLNFPRFIKHFLRDKQLSNAKVLDLGPGHFDFSVLIRLKGAHAIPLELDPAVIELGKYRGFEPLLFDLQKPNYVNTFGMGAIDGIFCNGSIDASWWPDPDAHEAYLTDLNECINPRGWALIAPCNSAISRDDTSETPHQRVQIRVLNKLGFNLIKLTDIERKYFGISSGVRPALVFVKNIEYVRFPWFRR